MATPNSLSIAGAALAIPLVSMLVRKGLLSQDEAMHVLASAQLQIAKVIAGDPEAVEAAHLVGEAMLAITRRGGPPSIWPGGS